MPTVATNNVDVTMTETHEPNPQLSVQDVQNTLDKIKDGLESASTNEQILNIMTELSNTTQAILGAQTKAPDFKTKLKSRKFWIAIMAAATGFIGILNSGGNTTTLIVFAVLEVVSILGYFFAEGSIDSTRTKEMIQAATAIAEILGTISPTLQESSMISSESSSTEKLPELEAVDPPAGVESREISYDEIGEGIDETDLHDAATEAAFKQ